MSKRVEVLIDADPLMYRVGFSLEQRVWHLQWRDVDPDHQDDEYKDRVHSARFFDAPSRDEFIRLMNLHDDEYTADLVSIPTAERYIVLGRTRQMLVDIERRVQEYLYSLGRRPGEFHLFLTGGGNFREQLATIKPYKGNRDRSLRPYWYDTIREYLIDRWGAEVVEGMEADDAVAIVQWNAGDDSIICTIDKDLLNVPGHHYNYHTKEATYVTYEEATLNFYRQILTGDSTDNIPGCYRVGKARAEKLLPEYCDEYLMWCTVVEEYTANMLQYPEHHAPHTDPVECATENARLVWMLRNVNEVWNPPA